jgi:ribose transport system ATP-binding protein
MTGGTAPRPNPPVIEINGLVKSFGATMALRGVDMALHAGRVHALLGANGCGKSTLVKVLARYHLPDAGRVAYHADPGAIAFVHQDLGLVPNASITENIALCTGFRTGRGVIRWRRQHADAAALLQTVGLDNDPRLPVSALAPAEQTMVAIARAIAGLPAHGGTLVLDEPTARLPTSEAERLLTMLHALKSRGMAILYISHRLDEVMRLADEVTVLRDGARVHHGVIGQTSREDLVRLIIGAGLTSTGPKPSRDAGGQLLQIDGLCGNRLHDVTLRLGPGELVGVAGLVGSGRSELGRLIFGLQKPTGGRVRFDGKDITGIDVAGAIKAGIGYVPQERRQGIFAGLSVADNAVMAELKSLTRGGMLSRQRAKQASEALVRQFRVKANDIDLPISTLSGGNQQKVAIGKWLRRDPSLLILDEPTQGIDIGAKTEIFHLLRAFATERGLAALVLDSDLEILADHCDRVAIMTRGRITAALAGDSLNLSSLNEAVYQH